MEMENRIKVWLVVMNSWCDKGVKLVSLMAIKETTERIGREFVTAYKVAEDSDEYEAGDWLDEDLVGESKEDAIKKAIIQCNRKINLNMEHISNELAISRKIKAL